MKILKTFNEETISETDARGFEHRIATRGIALDSENKMALLHSTTYGWYEIPGGGVEDGETVEESFRREMLEETGCRVEIVQEIGKTLEVRAKHKLLNDTRCYLSKVIGGKGAPDFQEDEDECGFEILWVTLDEAITLMESIPHHPDLYRRYLKQRALVILNEAKGLI